MTAQTRPSRLSKTDWLRTGLHVLASDGPSALRAEALARRMKTTKGSFYWHFADVPAFHAALIAHWEMAALAVLVETPEDDTPTGRLRHLTQNLACPGDGAAAVEPAIRGWSLSEPLAREALTRVDAARVSRLVALLRRIGVTNADMAHILRATAAGLALSDAPVTGAARMATLVDLILALR